MFPLENGKSLPSEPGLKETLWHCERCEAMITLHSVRPVRSAFCPVCREMEMEFCGTTGIAPGQGFARA